MTNRTLPRLISETQSPRMPLWESGIRWNALTRVSLRTRCRQTKKIRTAKHQNTKAHFRQFCQMRAHQAWKRKEDLAWQMWTCWTVWMVIKTGGRWIANRKRKSELRQSPFCSTNCSLYKTDFFFFFFISNKLKNKKKPKVDHTKTYKWECTNSLEFALRVFGSTT